MTSECSSPGKTDNGSCSSSSTLSCQFLTTRHDFIFQSLGSDNLVTSISVTREAAWISHIPWSFPFLKHLPSAAKSWTEMQVVGENIVKRRITTGSNNPDLFHYLVSCRKS